MAKTRTREDKNGMLQFYTGNRKATKEEIKSFIKTNYEITPKEKLSKEYSQYLGRVKGGHSRQKQAIRDDSGTFLTKDAQNALILALKRDMGINVPKIMEGSNIDSYDDIKKKNPKLAEDIERIKTTGAERSHNKGTAAKKIMEFTGKVFINGKEVSKETAARRINSTFSKLKRQFGNIDASVKFRYKGTKELRINLPTDGQIKSKGDSISEFLFSPISERGDFEQEEDEEGRISTNYDWLNDWQIYGS